MVLNSSISFFVSIHALTRSATKYEALRKRYGTFQSTHSRGVRRTGLIDINQMDVSIHALTRSATCSPTA